MQQHIKILAILNIVWGGITALGGAIVMLVLGGVAGFIGAMDHSAEAAIAAPIVGLVGGIVGIAMLVLSVPSIVAGIGLLNYRPWAKVLTIVLSALHLMSFPFGTALGVYGLWVLLSSQSEPLFRPASS